MFLDQLLSLREPISTSTSVPFLLKVSENHQDQIYYASCMLWSIAKLKSDKSLIKDCVETTKFKGLILEETQQSNIFSSCRIPGDTKDTIYVNRESRHVVVLWKGSAFIVNIISENDEAFNVSEIYAQMKVIQSYKGEQQSSICKFTSLRRDKWSKIRENIALNNKASLDLMENSIVTIAIEDEDSPTDYCEAINHVQFGDQTGNMRYHDKTINVIVYKNCVAGLLFEHTVVDGFLMCIFSKKLYLMGEYNRMEINQVKVPLSTDIKPISFQFDDSNIERGYSMPTISYFDFYGHQDMLNLFKEQKLYDIWINFSLQLAIKNTFGHLNFLYVTPTHVRHFKHGRSDPTYTITQKSLKLFEDLNCLKDSTDNIIYSFVEAVKEHRRKIKSTKLGHAIGPHICQIRNSLANKKDGNKLKLFLETFSCPAVYLTGYETVEEINFTLSNAYARDQLTTIYLGKADKVRIIMNTRGIFKEKRNDLMNNFQKALNILQNIVCKTAIALQMDALEALNSVQHPNNTMQESVAIVLHAGAGNKMSLQNEIKQLVEFSLQAALSIGIHSLKNGESALDAVEKVVTSLENCFFFNAGKGSIYNEEQKHELEAAIIDGTHQMSGSVACLTTVKNPIKAARLVMEKSSHSFIIGSKAEELAKEHGLSMVEDNSFFDTEFRRKEFYLDNSNAKNHTQTVGALALDIHGNLAAASSTGGTMKKTKGRISDTAVVGAGLYSDENVAIACSGNGEIFIRNSIASKIACYYNIKKMDLAKSCSEVLDKELGSNFGGVIGLTSDGTIVVDCRAEAMFIGSYDGHRSNVEILENVHSAHFKAPKSWLKPDLHAEIALIDPWYHMIFDIQNTLYHATVQFFHDILNFYYVITPITTQTISSPMGLGSDSEPVSVNISGEKVYMADSMQFALEYFLRLKNNLLGTYYISPSFRDESPDSTHLNQFYHVECELLGDMDAAIDVAEKYIIHLAREFLTKHSSMISRVAGGVSHIESLLKSFEKNQKFPRIKLDDALSMMDGSDKFYESIVEGKPKYGKKLTRKGEKYLIEHFHGPVWLTDMNHLGVPFYQAYANGDKTKAKAADLLLGLGETLGLGERHEIAKQVQEALAHHQVDEKAYDWYINMRRVKPLLTSGWGMGTERFLCWLLQHDDVRDMHVIPRLNGITFLP
ncbi:unnamed protein product [Rotaria sp. Silwood2]|nr:unnamed protein product [Rotaria sp. Silwood2]CAF4181394.1 unnamed protein product [Rotaria sp. Silwood2]